VGELAVGLSHRKSSSTSVVRRMAMAHSPTLPSNLPASGRNEVIAVSIAARCLLWSAMAERSSSARRCSVTSSWVVTQPPLGNGSLLTSTMRPSLAPTYMQLLLAVRASSKMRRQ
jgi:hypothetical protein